MSRKHRLQHEAKRAQLDHYHALDAEPAEGWDGIDADAHAVRAFGEVGIPFFVSNSFSKSFSLYGERVGALSIVAHFRGMRRDYSTQGGRTFFFFSR
jgi:hypothetical protein